MNSIHGRIWLWVGSDPNHVKRDDSYIVGCIKQHYIFLTDAAATSLFIFNNQRRKEMVELAFFSSRSAKQNKKILGTGIITYLWDQIASWQKLPENKNPQSL